MASNLSIKEIKLSNKFRIYLTDDVHYQFLCAVKEYQLNGNIRF